MSGNMWTEHPECDLCGEDIAETHLTVSGAWLCDACDPMVKRAERLSRGPNQSPHGGTQGENP